MKKIIKKFIEKNQNLNLNDIEKFILKIAKEITSCKNNDINKNNFNMHKKQLLINKIINENINNFVIKNEIKYNFNECMSKYNMMFFKYIESLKIDNVINKKICLMIYYLCINKINNNNNFLENNATLLENINFNNYKNFCVEDIFKFFNIKEIKNFNMLLNTINF